MDLAHTAAALARADQLVARLMLREADTANHLAPRLI